jgi:hypothetical protein
MAKAGQSSKDCRVETLSAGLWGWRHLVCANQHATRGLGAKCIHQRGAVPWPKSSHWPRGPELGYVSVTIRGDKTEP